ncbi:MAG: MYXO-CTERM domain-containing protein [Bradymonadia bacterium]|jgi:MYXO-CTERM domain-containing protein
MAHDLLYLGELPRAVPADSHHYSRSAEASEMKHPFKVLTFALLAAGYASTAYADECATDDDCPTGFACEFWHSDCADGPPCLPGEECSESEPCVGEEYSSCVPAPTACETNDDCSDEWECVTFTYEDCWGEDTPQPAPAPDEPGSGGSDDEPDGDEEDDREDPGESFECETVSEAYCAPPYVAPCEVDSDCGDGFGCIEIEQCSCGGSDGSGSSGSSGGSSDPSPVPPEEGGDDSGGDSGSDDDEPSDGDGMPVEEPDCECTGAGEFYCEPMDIDCEADSDCPDEWTCESWGVSTSVPCFEDEDGNVICEDEGTAEEDSQCEPPGWGAWGGAAGGGYDEDLANGPARATAEEGGSDDAANGIPFAAAPADEDGCSSSSTAPRGAGLLALLALVGLRRRR